MITIDTTLTTSGNSTAVRLPKELLRMSGISSKSNVRLEAKKGKIIISKGTHPREGWASQIKAITKSETKSEPNSPADIAQEFSDMDAAAHDGLEDVAWDGPSFEEWQKCRP